MFGKAADGLGDVRLGASFWPLANRESGQYLAISALVSLPTGDYQREQLLNIGENRSKATLTLGWVQPLTKSLVLELTPELAWYGDNPDYLGNKRLSQAHTAALTAYLRYRATPNWQFHAGWQENRGGETRVNDVRQNNAPDNSRWMLGATFTSVDRKNQWIARLAGDSVVENGFKTDAEVLVRYLRMF
jgi:hypothetical protein